MAGMAVSASMGVMNPLLTKLTNLMGDEYKKLKGVGKQVPFLRDELSAMNAFLEKLAFMDDNELDPLTRDWRNHVREMSYDMEDCIDDFMHHLDGADAGFVKNIARRLKTLRSRHQIANQIDELKARVVEANERRKRYELDDCRSTSTSTLVPVDPRISALYKEVATLVGIDGPRKELVELLTDSEQQLKVVSIVGFGGLGKTTLAKVVYDKITERFDCKAFISVSQRPDMTRLLENIVSKLEIERSAQAACEVQDIIDVLRGYLTDRRYIIVVDDLWDQEAWNIISCVFPENNNGSRVIVTTRLEDVASRACGNHRYMYKMKPLNDHDSRKLFLKRIFGSEDCCPSQYVEVSTEILKKCGGLPLAIITIASLLASRPSRIMEEWESIRNSLGAQFGRNHPSLEGMRQILNLSYKNLPLHLRTCLLYLCKYPEDYDINRDDLIRQWVAEGFVISNSRGQDLDDLAKSYFNELINRGLIQPTYTDCGEVLFCMLHDMMLDFILSRCAGDNFMSVVYSWEDYMARQHGYCKVRRLSLNSHSGGAAESDCTTIEAILPASLAQVRSVALFGIFNDRFPLLLPLKHLRVLHLRGSTLTDRVDLTVISQMLQLRYLKVELDKYFKVDAYPFRVIELPSRICGLVHLETLEIDGLGPRSLPSDIVGLPRLSHLIVPLGTRLPDGVGNMRSLRTLKDVLDTDVKDVKDLGELTNLRDLSLYCAKESVPTAAGSCNLHLVALGSSIGKLPNLRNLEISNDMMDDHDDDDWLVSLCDIAARGIERVVLREWCLSRVPRWINAGLRSLRILELDVGKTSTDDLGLLGELPSLAKLHLGLQAPVSRDASRAALVFGGTIRGLSVFPALEILVFRFVGDAVASCLVFQEGVMPKLRELQLYFRNCEAGSMMGTPAGMEHLLSLQSIHVAIHTKRVGVPADDEDHLPQEAEAAASYPKDANERVFRDAAQAHPNRPSLTYRQG